jgi:hypothetical protein
MKTEDPAASAGSFKDRALAHPNATLAIVALALAALYAAFVRHGPALTDEYVYLASARYFADAGSLDSRFYNDTAILSQGYPHWDMHAPGYTILLGAWSRVFPFGYAAAVALNLAAYVATVLLVPALARRLGLGHDLAPGIVTAFLPALLPYVFWVLPEVVLVPLILATLVLAAGQTRASAGGAGVAWIAAMLIRESALFALPAALVLVRRRGRFVPFAATVAVLLVTVFLPLARNRGEGGTNFWRETSQNSAVQFSAVRAAAYGELAAAWARTTDRASANWVMLRDQFSATENAMLLLLVALPMIAAWRWRTLDGRAREYLVAISLGTAAIVFCMIGVFYVPPWSGIRYLMAFGPPFLALMAGRRLALAALLLAFLGVNVSALDIFNDYKRSRQRRQEGMTEYVDRYVPPGQTRIVFIGGYHYGWKHYPVEVIANAPQEEEPLRYLAQAIWFDYVIVPAEADVRRMDKRERWKRLNPEDPEPPLLIYKRLR